MWGPEKFLNLKLGILCNVGRDDKKNKNILSTIHILYQQTNREHTARKDREIASKDQEIAEQRGRVQQLQEVREGWTASNYRVYHLYMHIHVRNYIWEKLD